MSKYELMLDSLHNTVPQPNPNYYQVIMDNSKVILLQISIQNQHLVSKDLKMDRMRLSHLMPLLRELALKEV